MNTILVYRKERREAAEILRRFLKGEIGEDLLTGFMDRLDLHSVPHVFETLELGQEDLRGMAITDEDLARPLREFLEGRLSLGSLKSHVLRVSQIVNAIDGKTSLVAGPEMTEALNILSLVLDPGAPLSARRVPTYLAPILEALDGAGPVPFRRVMERVLQDLGTFHFTTLCLSESAEGGDGARLPWTDLALLYGPPIGSDPRGDEIPEANLTPIWFIPLSVTTHRFYREGLPAKLGEDPEQESGWMLAANCRIPRLRSLHPCLPPDPRRPMYFIDPHGFAEIILDVEELSRDDIAFVIRLFALENGAAGASLDGMPVELFRPPALV